MSRAGSTRHRTALPLVDPGMSDEPGDCEQDPPDREPTAEELVPVVEDIDDFRGIGSF